MKRFLTLLALSSLFITACQSEEPEMLPEVGNTVTAPILEEEPVLLDLDWDEKDTELGTRYTTYIENPSTGAELYTYLEVPDGKGTFPMVMLVPGGLSSGSEGFWNDPTVDFFLDNGIAVAYFDPDGRGESDGDEDVNGYDQQDGLYAVSKALEQTEWIDTEEMGIISFSYGTTLASGMLARYADDQPYEWYVDWEGPSAREYTTVGCGLDGDGPSSEELNHDCDDDEFWSERESVTFLAEITIPYWRIQGLKDHVQSSNEHALDAINAATNGLSPWTRLNLAEPNQTFSMQNEPQYIKNASRSMALESALEFFDMY